MKKYLLMAALAFSALNMSAQKFQFGLNAGVGSSSIVGSEADRYKGSIYYKVGATVDYNISDNFAIVSGVDVINKRHKEEKNTLGYDINRTLDKVFVEIPILAAYKFNVSDNSNITLKAGPYVAIGVAGSKDYDVTGEEIFKSNYFNRGDVGIKVAASYDICHFTIGAEFSNGVRKINRGTKGFNQTIGVVLGYKF